MIFLNNYCTDFMFLVVILCGALSSTSLSLIILNSPLVFKISLFFVEIHVKLYKLYSEIPTNKIDILKRKGELKVMRQYCRYYWYAQHEM